MKLTISLSFYKVFVVSKGHHAGSIYVGVVCACSIGSVEWVDFIL